MRLCGKQLVSVFNQDQPKSRLTNLSFTYVQGMNVLLAPLLFVLPELDAFYCLSHLITHSFPLYVQPALEGVHCGVKVAI
jgi:cell cycle arrest protein BUB2